MEGKHATEHLGVYLLGDLQMMKGRRSWKESGEGRRASQQQAGKTPGSSLCRHLPSTLAHSLYYLLAFCSLLMHSSILLSLPVFISVSSVIPCVLCVW